MQNLVKVAQWFLRKASFNFHMLMTLAFNTHTLTTLVNVYVTLPVFTSVAGRSYAHFMEQNGGAHDVNR